MRACGDANDRTLEFEIAEAGRDKADCANFEDVKNTIMGKLQVLHTTPVIEINPLIYHLDVGVSHAVRHTRSPLLRACSCAAVACLACRPRRISDCACVAWRVAGCRQCIPTSFSPIVCSQWQLSIRLVARSFLPPFLRPSWRSLSFISLFPVLCSRLQSVCAACDFNRPGKTCQRYVTNVREQ